jgi:hypothetical protein
MARDSLPLQLERCHRARALGFKMFQPSLRSSVSGLSNKMERHRVKIFSFIYSEKVPGFYIQYQGKQVGKWHAAQGRSTGILRFQQGYSAPFSFFFFLVFGLMFLNIRSLGENIGG